MDGKIHKVDVMGIAVTTATRLESQQALTLLTIPHRLSRGMSFLANMKVVVKTIVMWSLLVLG